MYMIDILESFRKSLEACRDGVLSVSNRRITAAHVVGEPVNFHGRRSVMFRASGGIVAEKTPT